MIDVTFLLIVFFVVVSQIVDRDVVPLDLPAPENAKALVSVSDNKMVINVVPFSDGGVARIVVSEHTVGTDEMDKLSVIVGQGLANGGKRSALASGSLNKISIRSRGDRSSPKCGWKSAVTFGC